MEALLYFFIWILVGTLIFFVRAMLDSLSNRLHLVHELNELSTVSHLNRGGYYLSLIILHFIFMPIGFFLLIGDAIRVLVASLSKDETGFRQ